MPYTTPKPGVAASSDPTRKFAYHEDQHKRGSQEDAIAWRHFKKGMFDKLTPQQIGERLWTSYQVLDERVQRDRIPGGTTASTTVYDGKGNFVTATLGDASSFAVVYGKNGKPLRVVRLNNIVHKPDTKEEQERISQAGGTVALIRSEAEQMAGLRAWTNDLVAKGHRALPHTDQELRQYIDTTPRVNGQIAVSRAVGDHGYRGKDGKRLVCAQARIDITSTAELTAGLNADEIGSIQVISACDGFTDGAGRERQTKEGHEAFLMAVLQALDPPPAGTRPESEVAQFCVNSAKFNSTDNISVAVQGAGEDPFLIGLYDGHGNTAAVSSFVAGNMEGEFERQCLLDPKQYAEQAYSSTNMSAEYARDTKFARVVPAGQYDYINFLIVYAEAMNMDVRYHPSSIEGVIPDPSNKQLIFENEDLYRLYVTTMNLDLQRPSPSALAAYEEARHKLNPNYGLPRASTPEATPYRQVVLATPLEVSFFQFACMSAGVAGKDPQNIPGVDASQNRLVFKNKALHDFYMAQKGINYDVELKRNGRPFPPHLQEAIAAVRRDMGLVTTSPSRTPEIPVAQAVPIPVAVNPIPKQPPASSTSPKREIGSKEEFDAFMKELGAINPRVAAAGLVTFANDFLIFTDEKVYQLYLSHQQVNNKYNAISPSARTEYQQLAKEMSAYSLPQTAMSQGERASPTGSPAQSKHSSSFEKRVLVSDVNTEFHWLKYAYMYAINDLGSVPDRIKGVEVSGTQLIFTNAALYDLYLAEKRMDFQAKVSSGNLPRFTSDFQDAARRVREFIKEVTPPTVPQPGGLPINPISNGTPPSPRGPVVTAVPVPPTALPQREFSATIKSVANPQGALASIAVFYTESYLMQPRGTPLVRLDGVKIGANGQDLVFNNQELYEVVQVHKRIWGRGGNPIKQDWEDLEGIRARYAHQKAPNSREAFFNYKAQMHNEKNKPPMREASPQQERAIDKLVDEAPPADQSKPGM